MSYGSDVADSYRLAGIITSRRISRDEPRVARVDFLLANGESLVVEVPRYVLETPSSASKASHRSSAASRPRAFGRPFGPFPEQITAGRVHDPNSAADHGHLSGVAYPNMLHINPIWPVTDWDLFRRRIT
jgi:hypothetical protein